MKTILLCCLLFAPLCFADWPGYRGPRQDGISHETLNLDWKDHPPKVLWKVPLNTGFSSFAVGEGLALTQVVREIKGAPREICLALDADTGKERWAADVAVGKGYEGGETGGGPDGPRSTPAISGGRVFVLTPDLVLHALDAKSGAPLWKHDLIEKYGAENIGWKSSASPIVEDGLVFVMGGGKDQSLLAFRQDTGEPAWKTGTEGITHATPVLATIHGVRQVIYYCRSGLVSLDAKDGKLLWKFPCKYRASAAASPVVEGDLVFCTAGYDTGGAVAKITRDGEGFTATEVWRTPGNKEVASHFSTPVCKDGFLYGMFSFRGYGTGPLKCVEMATGQIRWSQPGFGQGNVILASSKLLALADNGDLVVVEPTPEAYKELVRIKAVEGKCWSTPAVSNGRIYVRSAQEGVCLDSSK